MKLKVGDLLILYGKDCYEVTEIKGKTIYIDWVINKHEKFRQIKTYEEGELSDPRVWRKLTKLEKALK